MMLLLRVEFNGELLSVCTEYHHKEVCPMRVEQSTRKHHYYTLMSLIRVQNDPVPHHPRCKRRLFRLPRSQKKLILSSL